MTNVFDFGAAHSLKQLKQNRAALLQVLENIRQTLSRLFQTQLIFHMEGSRAGRLMLEAQEELTGVLDAIDALSDAMSEDDDREPGKIRELHARLQHVGALTQEAAKRLRAIKA